MSEETRSRIQVLPPGVAERIAAGEVIERPASVIKELVENSLDAGSTEIAVILEDGGKSLIEILDNGQGMTAQDLDLSIQRHATSKLSTLADLENIQSLGFRGEALASIAAVTDLSLVSRAKGASQAFELKAGDVTERRIQTPTAEPITFGHFLNSPHGTRIRARGLFSQIPARLKFLKSQAAEVSQTREWLERLALAYPHVGFRLVSNDREILSFRPQSELERVKTLLSDEGDFPILTSETEPDGFRDLGLHIRIHWVQGLSTSTSRKLLQIVNHRAVRDKMLQQALLVPFKQALLPGQFPAAALFIEINPAAIDVNVHPSKLEIRFLDQRKIFSSIDSLIKALIQKRGAPAFAAAFSPPPSQKDSIPFAAPAFSFQDQGSKRTEPVSSPEAPSFESSPAWPWSAPPKDPVPSRSAPPPSSSSFYSKTSTLPLGQTPAFLVENLPPRPTLRSSPLETSGRGPHSSLQESCREPSPAPFNASSNHPLQNARYLGVLFQTYLAYESASQMILVDQHAAHERVRYEAYRKKALRDPHSSDRPIEAQALLIPEAIRIPSEDRALMVDLLPELARLGFEAQCTGQEEPILLFRSVPAEWGKWGLSSLKPKLKNLVDRLTHFKKQEASDDQALSEPQTSMEPRASDPPSLLSVIFDEALFEGLASQACHSSVRAGDRLEPLEVESLAQQLFECEHPWNCPHGRPTVVIVPQSKFEEWFQRQV
ncbi:MAG: DNA mismatch repair endonuclease MutL [Bdellovibrionia bacterium]